MRLRAVNIDATHWVLSTLLVLGGDFSIVPPVTSTDMDGSVLKAVSVSQSTYPLPVAATLSEFKGTVNATGLANFTRVIINPEQDGSLLTGSTPVDVTDTSSLTDIYGRQYEAEFDTDGDLFGYTSKDVDDTARQLAMWLLIIFIVLVLLAVVLNQNILARYNEIEALKRANHDD